MLGLSEKNKFMVQLILPALVILIGFELIPVASAVWASLHRTRLYETASPFIGLANYKRLFTSSHFYTVTILNTFLFTFVGLGIETFLGVSIAVLLNRRFRGENVVRTILLFPLMISPAISGLMFSWLFNSQFGIIDVVLSALGLPPIMWLSGRWTAMLVVIISDVWIWTPWVTILILASLQIQPQDPVEAARLDGANALQVFSHVTLPYLSPVLVITLLIRTFDLFRQFDQVWAITAGGPARSTELFSIFAYKEFFEYTRYGRGNAAALMGAMVMMVFGLVMYRTFLRLTGPGARA